MQGILSLLDEAHTQHVAGLYAELEQRFGLRGIRAFTYPHITFYILDGYDLPAVEAGLRETVRRLKPFKVRTAGLGIFLNPSPVLFAQVVRSPALERIHRLLRRTFPPLKGTGGYYSAEEWMPHITLARADLTLEMLPEVVALLARHDFRWEITLDNLAFAAETADGIEIKCSCSFSAR